MDEKFRPQFPRRFRPASRPLLPDSARTGVNDGTQGSFANPEDEMGARRVRQMNWPPRLRATDKLLFQEDGFHSG